MKTFISSTKIWSSEFAAFARRHAVFLLVLTALLVFALLAAQKSCDKRRALSEDAELKRLSEDADSREREFKEFWLDVLEKQNKVTFSIIEQMDKMDKRITVLDEQDKAITARVNEIETGEYRKARFQKNNQAQIKAGKVIKADKPLKTRETDALKMDALLYPSVDDKIK